MSGGVGSRVLISCPSPTNNTNDYACCINRSKRYIGAGLSRHIITLYIYFELCLGVEDKDR